MKAIRINPEDNVIVMLEDGKILENIEIDGIKPLCLKEDILRGHKAALTDIKEGSPVIKYGNIIGYAVKDIKEGEWVHTHNMTTGLSDIIEYSYEPDEKSLKADNKIPETCFKGYLRKNGEAGIRNEVWVIPTVACVNDIARRIAGIGTEYLKEQGAGVDCVTAFTHPYGCSQTGEDKDTCERIIADLATHPNAGGVLVVGLGCENSGVEQIKDKLKNYDPERIRFMICQDEDDEIKEGSRIVEELIDLASKDERSQLGVSKLVIGLKCGGSDGLSGITANPLVGMISDRITGMGGSCILTEVPEMFGAEKLLMNRCESRELFLKLVDMINGFKEYFLKAGQNIYENPSPGNKKGGISTLEDKSLGCTQKSGTSPVRGILGYGEIVKNKGLNLLYGPGNDPVAATALAASHAQIILFTTGRGTPFAAPVPTLKISSNSNLAKKKSSWIDYDAGVLTAGKRKDEAADELLLMILDCACGRKVRSEESGYHDMAIFKRGITL